MNSLERALITKAGYDNGWEVVVEDTPRKVVLASAMHRAQAQIAAASPASGWVAAFSPAQLHRELRHGSSEYTWTDGYCEVATENALGKLLRHAARIARTLPDAPEARFAQAVAKELETKGLGATEIERLVRQRIGQDIFRESLFDYWGGACAVTGIAIPELLRASHAKAWAKCETDAERLNVFNGFLLVAHLDALFDRYLMTFDQSGAAIFAPVINTGLRTQLGLTTPLKLRWMRPEHDEFLSWHRNMARERWPESTYPGSNSNPGSRK